MLRGCFMLPKRCAPVKLVRLVSRMYTGSQWQDSGIEGTGFHFWKKVVSFFLKRWFSHVQFFETNMMFNGNFSVFQTREWLVTPWVMTCLWLKRAVHVRSTFSREMASLKGMERQSQWLNSWWSYILTHWVVVFYSFFKRAKKKTCFCCGLWVNQFRLGILLVGRWWSWKIDGRWLIDEWWGWMFSGGSAGSVGFFFIDITCHFLFRPSENGLFHPKRSCQHEK